MNYFLLKEFVRDVLEGDGIVDPEEMPDFTGEEPGFEYFSLSEDEYHGLRLDILENIGLDIGQTGAPLGLYEDPPVDASPFDDEPQPDDAEPEGEELAEEAEDKIGFSPADYKSQRSDFLKKHGDQPIKDLTPKQLERHGVVLKIPEDILSDAEQMIEGAAKLSEDFTRGEFAEVRDWYDDLNEFFLSYYDEEPRNLLLALLFAAFSPQTAIKDNVVEALITELAIAYDLKNGLAEDLDKFVNDPPMNQGQVTQAKTAALQDKYGHLALFYCWATLLNFTGAKWRNFQAVFNLYRQGNLTHERVLKMIVQDLRFNKPLEVINKLKLSTKTRQLVGAMKVANFAMNILYPDAARRNTDFLLNSTIDVWMVRAFYPHVDGRQQAKIAADPMSYLYIAGFIQRIAAKYNLQPHQAQAIVWTVVRTKWKKRAPTLTGLDHFFNTTATIRKEDLREIKETSSRVGNLRAKSRQLQAAFKSLDDFKNIKAILAAGSAPNGGDE